MTALPTPPLPIAEALPDTLRAVPRYVCWKYITKIDKHGKEKLDKPPVHPDGGYSINAHDPANWLTFDQAHAAAARHHRGVGLDLDGSDDLAGVDIDHCIDPETDELSPEAAALVAEFNSYAERSPSNRGVRIWCRATLPGDGHKRGNLEIYQRGRYLTVTGRHIPGTPREVRPAQEAAMRLWERLAPAQGEQRQPSEPPAARTSTLDEETVIAAIRASKQGTKFDQLMRGDTSGYGGDPSSATIALCDILAGWCDDDPSLMDRIFRRSGLMRDKWSEKRGTSTWGRQQIDHARGFVTWRYDWHPPTLVGLESEQAAATGAPTPELAACQAEVTYWKDLALRYKAERDEARVTIRAMRAALSNDNLGTERIAGIALAFEVGATPEHIIKEVGVDRQTGEVLTKAIPLRDATGATRVYIGHGSEDEDGKATRGLAGAIGMTANTTSRQLRRLRDDGVIDLDVRKVRDDDGDIQTQTWVRFRGLDARAEPPKVSDLLTVIARAGRPPEAPRHGDPARFTAEPAVCPQCGSKHVKLTCLDCGHEAVMTPSPQDGESDTSHPSSVDTTSIGPQDGDSEPSNQDGGSADRLDRIRRLRDVRPAPTRIKVLCANASTQGCTGEAGASGYCPECEYAGWGQPEAPAAAPSGSSGAPARPCSMGHAGAWRRSPLGTGWICGACYPEQEAVNGD